jgi:hypothetical protein
VTGPASATDGHVVLFDGATGKLIKSSGLTLTYFDTLYFGGSTGATDNALLRADGTGGKTGQASPAIVGDDGAIYGYREHHITVSGTTYTVDATVASGAVLRFTSATAVTITLANDLPTGWCASWRQIGAGQLTFSAGSGATLNNRPGHTKSAGAGAWGALACDSNAGAAAIVYLGGDTAA